MVATLPLGAGCHGADERVDGQGVRRVGRRGDHDVCRRRRRSCSARTRDWFELTLGMLFVLAIGLCIGAVHVALIRWLNLTPIIATLATYSIMQGIGWWLRLTPKGTISSSSSTRRSTAWASCRWRSSWWLSSRSLADVWLYRTAGGLAARAMGLDEESAARRGVRVRFLFVRAFFISGFVAAIGGLFLAAQVQIGDSNAGLQLHAAQHRRGRARRGEPAGRPGLVHRRPDRRVLLEPDPRTSCRSSAGTRRTGRSWSGC